jgi:hypothetical protein
MWFVFRADHVFRFLERFSLNFDLCFVRSNPLAACACEYVWSSNRWQTLFVMSLLLRHRTRFGISVYTLYKASVVNVTSRVIEEFMNKCAGRLLYKSLIILLYNQFFLFSLRFCKINQLAARCFTGPRIWRALVSTLEGLPVPWGRGSFFTGWVTVSFSRGTPQRGVICFVGWLSWAQPASYPVGNRSSFGVGAWS